MKPEEYASLLRLGEKHWWFKGTRDILFSSVFRDSLHGKPVLDVGCGSGIMMKKFGDTTTVFGIDVNRGALEHCRGIGFSRLCQAQAGSIPFKSESFELVMATDLLEHCEDDQSVLREFFRIMTKRGILLTSVPAYRRLWSGHDVALHHQRRYSKSELVRKVESAGFIVTRVSFFNTFLFAPVAVIRLIQGLLHKNPSDYHIDYHEDWRMLNRIFYAVMRIELALVRRINLPFGLSIFLLASKT